MPQCLLGDSGRLKQVLLNLIGNASSYAQGEITVSAAVAK